MVKGLANQKKGYGMDSGGVATKPEEVKSSRPKYHAG